MVFAYFDRVKESSVTTGTGNVSLAGAITGFRSFVSVYANGDTMYYTICDQAGANWEVGLGTYVSSGNQLSRTTVKASSNSGSLVNFTSGSLFVFTTIAAAQLLNVGNSTLGTGNIVLASAAPNATFQKFTTSGTYTPTANMIYCIAEGVGSGGGGGGGSSAGTGSGGSGGGGGEYGRVILTAAQVGVSQVVTIGTASAGGTTTNAGTDGATTSLGTLLSCAGGSKGNAGSTDLVPGGLGGNANGAGNLHIPGQSGGYAITITTGLAGSGGNSYFGAGGVFATTSGSNAPGVAGVGFGAGGSGAVGNGTGGSSTAGLIFITEYIG